MSGVLDIKTYDIFPITLCRVVLDMDHAAIAAHSVEWIDKCDRYTTYHDRKLNDQWFEQMPDRDVFVQSVYQSTNEFLKRSKRKPFTSIDDMYLWAWVSKYEKGDQHGSHNHPRSLISGTYYPQADSTSSQISYDSPVMAYMMHDSIDFGTTNHSVQPKTGDMMLWPSWLFHRVHPQKETTLPRIAISFNVDYSRYYK